MTVPTTAAPKSRRTARRAALATVLVGALTAGGFIVASSAQATILNYTGSTSGTQSSITTHKGDSYERTLNPSGTVAATLDDTNKKVTSSTVSLNPVFTPVFVVSGIHVYVKSEFEQIGNVTGTIAHTATEGIDTISVNSVSRLHVTVYHATSSTELHPDTDGKLADGAKCWVDVNLALSGPANRRTGFLSLAASQFTIPTFPSPTTGTADHNCGSYGTPGLNTALAGANNSMALNFTGGPTTVHYTGVSTGDQSTIVVRKGDPIFGKTIHPTSSLVADIDFRTNTISNTVTKFDRVNVPALPGLLASFPVYAHIDMTTIGTPVSTLSPSGTVGIDNVTVSTKARMAVTVTAISNDLKLTNPATCFVNLTLNLSGTEDRGTDKLSLSGKFTIPAFPLFGCGLLSTGLTTMVSGPSNTINLNYVDGVVS
jgi:hypothetical protein